MSSAKRFAIGIAGLGHWGPNLLRNIADHPALSVAALCDRDPARLATFHQLHPAARVYTDIQGLVDDGGLDAVILATPAGLHEQQAHLMLDAGLDVFVEKPLALSLAGARGLVEKARRLGRVLMTGHTFLFNPAVQRAREEILSGRLGPLRFISAQRLSLGQVRSDCNALWNLAPHDVSILLYWLDAMPTSVTARGIAFHPPHSQEDIVLATMEFPGPVLASIQVSWLNPIKVRSMTLVGTRSMMVYDDVETEKPLVLFDRGLQQEPSGAPEGSLEKFRLVIRRGSEEVLPVNWREPLAAEIDHFAQCLTTRQEPRGSGDTALQIISVLEACQRSIDRRGEPVVPEPVTP